MQEFKPKGLKQELRNVFLYVQEYGEIFNSDVQKDVR